MADTWIISNRTQSRVNHEQTPVISQTEQDKFHHSITDLLHSCAFFNRINLVNKSCPLAEHIPLATEVEEWEESVSDKSHSLHTEQG